MVNSIEQAAFKIAHLTALSRDEPIFTDIGSVVETDKNGVKSIHSALNRMNSLGYIPIVSTAVAVYRIFINLLGVIKNIAMAIFSPVESFRNLVNNITQVIRGVVEMVPIIGNITIYTIDQIRIKVIEYQIKQNNQNQETREYYANGRLVSSGIIASYQQDFNFMYMAGARFS